MIHSFRGTSTQKLYDSRKSRLWGNIQAVALRKLDQLEEVDQLSDLKQPPGNKLEALHGDRSGQHSIRIMISSEFASFGRTAERIRLRLWITTEARYVNAEHYCS